PGEQLEPHVIRLGPRDPEISSKRTTSPRPCARPRPRAVASSRLGGAKALREHGGSRAPSPPTTPRETPCPSRLRQPGLDRRRVPVCARVATPAHGPAFRARPLVFEWERVCGSRGGVG